MYDRTKHIYESQENNKTFTHVCSSWSAHVTTWLLFFYWWGSFGEIHRHCWKEPSSKFESDSSEASIDIALRSWGILQLLPSTIQTSVKCCDFPALYLRYFATSVSQTWHIYYFRLSFQAVSTNFHQLIHVKSWKTVEALLSAGAVFHVKKMEFSLFFCSWLQLLWHGKDVQWDRWQRVWGRHLFRNCLLSKVEAHGGR